MDEKEWTEKERLVAIRTLADKVRDSMNRHESTALSIYEHVELISHLAGMSTAFLNLNRDSIARLLK